MSWPVAFERVVGVGESRYGSDDVAALAVVAASGLDLAVREVARGHKDLARAVLADVRATVLKAEKALR